MRQTVKVEQHAELVQSKINLISQWGGVVVFEQAPRGFDFSVVEFK